MDGNNTQARKIYSELEAKLRESFYGAGIEPHNVQLERSSVVRGTRATFNLLLNRRVAARAATIEELNFFCLGSLTMKLALVQRGDISHRRAFAAVPEAFSDEFSQQIEHEDARMAARKMTAAQKRAMATPKKRMGRPPLPRDKDGNIIRDGDNATVAARKKPGRKPFPRDKDGNIIRPTDAKAKAPAKKAATPSTERRKPGRKPYPRDAQGNIIRPGDDARQAARKEPRKARESFMPNMARDEDVPEFLKKGLRAAA